MKKQISIVSILIATSLHAAPIVLTWQDNSDNEDKFVMEGRLPDQTWEEVGVALANLTEMQVETEGYTAWRVKAVNAWGSSGYSNVLQKDIPQAPSNLGPKKAPQYGKYKKYDERAKRDS